MAQEKFLGELAHLNVVPAQLGKVFHKHRRDVPGLDGGDHFLKAGRFMVVPVIPSSTKNSVRIVLVLGGLLENFLLVLDAVGFAVHVIVTAQTAVESGCADSGFLA